MDGLSIGQLRALSDFFNTVAAAWFVGGIVTPFFVGASPIEKLQFSVAGVLYSGVFLSLSLFFVKEVNR
jgi:hypothetical protein